jgi:hypothetical protein
VGALGYTSYFFWVFLGKEGSKREAKDGYGNVYERCGRLLGGSRRVFGCRSMEVRLGGHRGVPGPR